MTGRFTLDKITLSLPPTLNKSYKGARGRLVMSDEAAAWKSATAFYLNTLHLEPCMDRVEVSMFVYRYKRAGDVDGRVKIVLDALQGHVYVNDSQVDILHIFNRIDADNPRVELFFRRLLPDENSVASLVRPRRRRRAP